MYDINTRGSGEAALVVVSAANYQPCEYTNVFNNTIASAQGEGIRCIAYQTPAGAEVNYNIFKNNIVICDGQALFANYGGNNVSTGTGNVYESNCFGAERSNFIRWGSTNYSTYDAWIAASSQTDNNVESDPLFVDANGDDYALAFNSPCIGVGENLGAAYDDSLMPASSWPDGVVTGDQDDY
jgi:hypothetical protein